MSWRPRALYFPNFATAEQCESIIKLAEPRLRPSTVALRPGETADSTQGIRTRYLLCVCECSIFIIIYTVTILLFYIRLLGISRGPFIDIIIKG